jgi:hypothetical protein
MECEIICKHAFPFALSWLYINKYRNLRTQQMLVHSLVCILQTTWRWPPIGAETCREKPHTKLCTNICCVRRFLYLLIDTRATGCINQFRLIIHLNSWLIIHLEPCSRIRQLEISIQAGHSKASGDLSVSSAKKAYASAVNYFLECSNLSRGQQITNKTITYPVLSSHCGDNKFTWL